MGQAMGYAMKGCKEVIHDFLNRNGGDDFLT